MKIKIEEDAKKLYFEFKREKDKNEMVFIKMMHNSTFMIFTYFWTNLNDSFLQNFMYEIIC